MELLFKIEKSIYNMYQTLNRLPSLAELEKELHIDIDKIKHMMNYIFPVLSLDNAVSPDGELSLHDMISSKDFQPEEMVFNQQLRDYELKILKSLVSREAEVLKYRYGFYNDENLTLKKVAKMFKVSPEAIRQIELKALKRIRLNHQDLADYLVN
jgi:RNA polymerase primary sigma factor